LQELVEVIKAQGFKDAEATENVEQALIKANPNARILICGSLYLAGNVLATLSG
jgi:folylpolyglutamate synthase/dihydropteroate synthase